VKSAQLNLWGDPNYIPIAGGMLNQQLDHATITLTNGTTVPLHPGSTNLSIPDFVGCRGRGGDDLSRLITAMVSGDDNTAAIQQTFLIFHPKKGYRNPDDSNAGFNPGFPLSCAEDLPFCPTTPGYLDPLPVGK